MEERRWSLGILQRERDEWERLNFTKRSPEWLVLALVEEMGEVDTEVKTLKPGYFGGLYRELSDVVICLAGLCTGLGLEIHDLYAVALYGHACDAIPSEMAAVGRIARSVLKGAQGLKGTPEQHKADAELAIVQLLRYVDMVFRERGESLLEHVEENWQRVKQRDWKADPVRGGEA